MTEPLDQPVVRLAEAAKMLRIGLTKLHYLCKDRELEKLKIGGRAVITVSSIHAYLDRLRTPAQGKR